MARRAKCTARVNVPHTLVGADIQLLYFLLSRARGFPSPRFTLSSLIPPAGSAVGASFRLCVCSRSRSVKSLGSFARATLLSIAFPRSAIRDPQYLFFPPPRLMVPLDFPRERQRAFSKRARFRRAILRQYFRIIDLSIREIAAEKHSDAQSRAFSVHDHDSSNQLINPSANCTVKGATRVQTHACSAYLSPFHFQR